MIDRRIVVSLAAGCLYSTGSTPPGVSGGPSPGPGSAPGLPTVTSSSYGGYDTGLEFTPPDCTVPTPGWSTAPCAMPIDATVVADCAAGGHAAMRSGTGYATVADAIAAASLGDLVQMCPGTWAGTLVVDREVILEAADPTPGVTVIDGGGTTRGLEITSATTVRGLTVRNGNAAQGGGGIWVTTPGAVMECMTVEDNHGSAISALDGLTLRTSTLSRNTAGYDGGALAGEGTFLVEDTTFEGNTSGYEGGAVAVRGDATFTRTTFTENVADYAGGAIAWGDRDPFVLTLNESLFHCNASGYEGGAVSVGSWADDTAVIAGSTFTENYADYEGGAISFGSWGSIHLTLTSSTFHANVGGYEGGAIELGGWMDNGVFATLAAVTFTENVSEYGGGAISVGSRVPVGDLDGTGLVFHRNAAGGGAISLTTTTTFDCTGCDVGAGADDNVPYDAEKGGTVYQSLGANFSL